MKLSPTSRTGFDRPYISLEEDSREDRGLWIDTNPDLVTATPIDDARTPTKSELPELIRSNVARATGFVYQLLFRNQSLEDALSSSVSAVAPLTRFVAEIWANRSMQHMVLSATGCAHQVLDVAERVNNEIKQLGAIGWIRVPLAVCATQQLLYASLVRRSILPMVVDKGITNEKMAKVALVGIVTGVCIGAQYDAKRARRQKRKGTLSNVLGESENKSHLEVQGRKNALFNRFFAITAGGLAGSALFMFGKQGKMSDFWAMCFAAGAGYGTTMALDHSTRSLAEEITRRD